MRLAVYVAMAAILALAVLLRPAARGLRPKAAAILLAAGAFIAGLLWVACLGLVAFATIGRLGLAAAVGHWSAAVIQARNPVPLAAGLAGLAVLALVAISLLAALGGLSRELRRVVPLVRLARQHGAGDVAIIDHPVPEAMALPGWHGSILVTSGMLHCLRADEQPVLLAHERSHVRGRHWLFRLSCRVGAALLPALRSTVPACDQALERWADEDAAVVVGSRQLVATAIARAALAASKREASTVLVPAISDGAVVQRVEAMLAPSPRSRWGPAAVVALLVAVALTAAIDAERDVEGMFELARHLWLK
jgi:hypothetical protein